MQPKKCNFCKRAKKKFSFLFWFSIYFAILAIIGQIVLIKLIINYFNL